MHDVHVVLDIILIDHSPETICTSPEITLSIHLNSHPILTFLKIAHL